jgi:hypothetical protein
VAFMIAASVAPSGRFSRPRILAALLPSRAAPAFLAALGAFFGGLAFLADLAFFGATVRATYRDTGLLRTFRRLGRYGLGGFRFFCNGCHGVFSFVGGDYRGHDINHSGWAETQAKSERCRWRRWNGDGVATGAQMVADGCRW